MKTRVLLVDDDPHMRTLMDEALRFLGFHAVSVEGVVAALARLDGDVFDVVLTDHRMPGLRGFDLVRSLRERKFSGRIFVLSAVLSERDRLIYEGLEVDGMAAKPLTLAELNCMLKGLGEDSVLRF